MGSLESKRKQPKPSRCALSQQGEERKGEQQDTEREERQKEGWGPTTELLSLDLDNWWRTSLVLAAGAKNSWKWRRRGKKAGSVRGRSRRGERERRKWEKEGRGRERGRVFWPAVPLTGTSGNDRSCAALLTGLQRQTLFFISLSPSPNNAYAKCSLAYNCNDEKLCKM